VNVKLGLMDGEIVNVKTRTPRLAPSGARDRQSVKAI